MSVRAGSQLPGFSADNRVQLSEGLTVAIGRDPLHPEVRVRDPGEIHLRQQRKKHWINDSGPDAKPPSGVIEASQDSTSFLDHVEDARRRSKRLHTDPLDMEGPETFYETRKAMAYTRDLKIDDPMGGFKRGDTAALKLEGGQEEHVSNRGDSDFCVVLGKVWEPGHIEVKFYSDNQVAVVKPEHLVKIDRADVKARKLRLRMVDWQLGGEANQGPALPWQFQGRGRRFRSPVPAAQPARWLSHLTP
ncbi:unnamed protein product [Prorocentrum cordatum]|uniref:Uncharacterized protein n=1 Tax=Prorocentrum cordatum TaxID=2364126 RepID=A0ABN9S951_9DINO|nr:unnamed protein product [Polarella glacialis]